MAFLGLTVFASLLYVALGQGMPGGPRMGGPGMRGPGMGGPGMGGPGMGGPGMGGPGMGGPGMGGPGMGGPGMGGPGMMDPGMGGPGMMDPGMGGPGMGGPGMGAPGAMGGPPNSHMRRFNDPCTYLTSQPSGWGVNSAPFILYTRGYHHDIRADSPVEVSIRPYDWYTWENFTDFLIRAVEPMNAQQPEVEVAAGGAMGPPNLGYFQVDPRYSNGAGPLRCSRYSQGPDAAGSHEEWRMEIYRRMYPQNPYFRRQPRFRKYAAFLWYPSQEAMLSANIMFEAFIKSNGQWFKLESRMWPVFQEPNMWQNVGQTISSARLMRERMIKLERQAETAQI